MSLQARKELWVHIQVRYQAVVRSEKRRILNEFIATTGYQRKYAISLLNQSVGTPFSKEEKKIKGKGI